MSSLIALTPNSKTGWQTKVKNLKRWQNLHNLAECTKINEVDKDFLEKEVGDWGEGLLTIWKITPIVGKLT